MPNRRSFIKYLAAAGGLGLAQRVQAAESRKQTATGFFGVHPFVESHPEAVFVLRTAISDKHDSEGKSRSGCGSRGNSCFPIPAAARP